MPVPGFRNRQANAAFGTQARTVVAAQRLERKLQAHGIDEDGFEVDQVVFDPVDLIFGGSLIRDAVRVGEQLGEKQIDRFGELLETTRALTDSLGSNCTRDQNTFGHRLHPKIECDIGSGLDRVRINSSLAFHRDFHPNDTND